MNYEMNGNVALVTASSSGLGKASAKALAREGANVVINGRSEDRIAQAKQDVESVAAGGVLAVQGDLTENPDEIDNLVERTVEEFGGIDHLVTNAGGPPSGAFMEMDDHDWYDAFDLLVMSVVRLVREAAPYLREDGGGTIVTITSRSVKEAIPSLVLSNAVRMGVIGLEKKLSKELAPEVRSNACSPCAARDCPATGTHPGGRGQRRIRELRGRTRNEGRHQPARAYRRPDGTRRPRRVSVVRAVEFPQRGRHPRRRRTGRVQPLIT